MPMTSFERNKTLALSGRLALIIVLSFLWGCGVSHRVSRPKLTGKVYDAGSGQPLKGCQVGEAVTSADGSFELPQTSYREFVFGADSGAAMLVSEFVVLPGYEMVRIFSFTERGAPSPPSHWKVKPIFLRKVGEDGEEGTGSPWREVSSFVRMPAEDPSGSKPGGDEEGP